MNKIAELTKKEITKLSRQDLEDNIKKLVAEAKNNDIAILFGGDPLIATTHKIIYIEAKKLGIEVSVIHSASILSAAIGESGLDFYRFGQICTIPRWSEHYKPVSFYETIEKNQNSNQHSLLLLDYIQDKESSIQPRAAISVLEEAEGKYRKGIIKEDTKIIILHNLSQKGEEKTMQTISRARTLRLTEGPTVFVLPAKLVDTEKEVLDALFGE